MEDIKKTIEEEARIYAETIKPRMYNSNNFTHEMAYYDCVEHGANFILSKWEESERWRNVEEELPSEDGIYLVKTDKVRYAIAEYLGDYWVIDTNRYGVILRWKPID